MSCPTSSYPRQSGAVTLQGKPYTNPADYPDGVHNTAYAHEYAGTVVGSANMTAPPTACGVYISSPLTGAFTFEVGTIQNGSQCTSDVTVAAGECNVFLPLVNGADWTIVGSGAIEMHYTSDCGGAGATTTPPPEINIAPIAWWVDCADPTAGTALQIWEHDEVAGTYTVSFIDGSGATIAQPANGCPIGDKDFEQQEACYEDAAGDRFYRVSVIDTTTNPATTVSTYVWDAQTGGILAAMPAGVFPCGTAAKPESVSEVQVCDGTDTLIRKTVLNSDGTETVTFYGDNGAVATPAAYTIGACEVILTRIPAGTAELITADATVTVPADTWWISVYNASDSTITVTIGGDVWIVPAYGSLTKNRDTDRDPAYAASAVVTGMGAGEVVFDFTSF